VCGRASRTGYVRVFSVVCPSVRLCVCVSGNVARFIASHAALLYRRGPSVVANSRSKTPLFDAQCLQEEKLKYIFK